MAKDKLRYVKGYCELEDGTVRFIGGMSGVSNLQTWYHIIYAIKDKFPQIDYWINPKMEICQTLPSTANHLRYGICKSLKCTFEKFPNGEIRPKLKLSELDKRKYKSNRARIAEGVIPVLEFEPATELPGPSNIMLTDFDSLSIDENPDNKPGANTKNEAKTDFDASRDGVGINESLASNFEKRNAKLISDTTRDFNNILDKVVNLSHKLFNGSISVDEYMVDTANDINQLNTLATILEKHTTRTKKGNLILLNCNIKESARKVAHCYSRSNNDDKKKELSKISVELLSLHKRFQDKISTFSATYTSTVDRLDDISCQFDCLERYKKELTTLIDNVKSVLGDALNGDIDMDNLEKELDNLSEELNTLLIKVEELDKLYLKNVHINMATNIHVPISCYIECIKEYENDKDFSKALNKLKYIWTMAKDLYAMEGVEDIYLKGVCI